MMTDRHLHLFGEKFDPFAGSRPDDYSLDKFYTKGSDQNGNKADYRVSVDPQLAAQIARIVARQVIPEYQTYQDFVRDAIYHRLEYLKERIDSDALHRVLSEYLMNATAEAHQRAVANMKAAVRNWEQACEDSLSAQDWTLLQKQVDQMREYANGVREPYSGQFLKLAQRFERDLPDG